MLAVEQTTSDLIKARELIADGTHWCQGIFHTSDRERFCAVGALAVTTMPDFKWMLLTERFKGASKLLNRATANVYGPLFTVVNVNDRVGLEAVLQVFDKAIELSLSPDKEGHADVQAVP